MTRSFLDEWADVISKLHNPKGRPDAIIPIGEGAYKVLKPLMDELNRTLETEHQFVPVANKFFGGRVNVTGLLTGGDILSYAEEGKRIILPAVVLNKDSLFLDDMSLEEFKKSCPAKVEIAENARELLHYLVEE